MSASFGQWIPALAGAFLGVIASIYVLVSTRRLDARIRRRREPEADNGAAPT